MSAMVSTVEECVGPADVVSLAGEIAAAIQRVRPGVSAVQLGGSPVEFFAGMIACREVGLPMVAGRTSGADGTLPRHVRLCAGGTVVVESGGGSDGAEALGDFDVLFVSSGTSGRPKVVPHTADAMRYQATATAERMAVTSHTVLGVALPLDHAYGFSVANMAQVLGARLAVFHPHQRRAITAAIVDRTIDTLDSIPLVWRYLAMAAAHDPRLRAGIRALRVRGVGGQMLSPALAHRYEELGAPLHDGYGLSEAGPNVSINVGDGCRPRSVGPPLTGVRVSVGPEDELLVASPSVSPVLWDGGLRPNPQVTPDGWLRTRDAGDVRDGVVRVAGRMDTMILRNGEKLAPEVLEHLLQPAVDDPVQVLVAGCHVGGDAGDAIVAFVVHDHRVRPDSAVSAVTAAAAAVPPPFTVSKVVAVRDTDLVTGPGGKPARRYLSDLARQWLMA